MRRLFAFVVACVPLLASADVCTQYKAEGTGRTGYITTAFYADPVAACQEWKTTFMAQVATQNFDNANPNFTIDSCAGSLMSGTFTFQFPNNPQGVYNYGASLIPRSGDFCSNPCHAGTTKSEGYYDVGTDPGARPTLLGCDGTCESVFDGTSPAGSAMVNGVKHYYAKGSYITTGNQCTSSGGGADNTPSPPVTPPDTPPPDTCPAGYDKGVVNGKTYCAPRTNTPPASAPGGGDAGQTPNPTGDLPGVTNTTKAPPVTNPDGSTTTTTTTTTRNSDGSTSTTTTRDTTWPNGSSTRDVIVTGTDRNGDGKVDDPADTEKAKCEKNPSDAGCGGAPATITDLRTKGTKTVGDVLGSAKDAFLASPIGAATAGFWTVSGGGSCPTWNLSFTLFGRSMGGTFDQFCSTWATNALLVLKTCILIVFAWFACRIALD